MRSLLIGGNGFIGSSLAETLIQKGRTVTIIGRSTRPLNELPAGVRYVSGDFGNLQLIRSLLSKNDEVIHLSYATPPNTSFEAPMHDLMENLPSTVNLLAEATRTGIKRLVIVSSGGTVYGQPKNLPIDEEEEARPLSPYGITKLTVENYARWFHSVYGLPVLCVRPSNAFGEGQLPYRGQGFVSTAIASVLQGKPLTIFGERGTVRDYIHVSDVSVAIADVLNHGVPGEVYNIGTGIGLNNMDVIERIDRIAEKYNMHSRIVFADARPFDVAANILNCKKLNNLTGWFPKIDFNEGLELTWNWLRARYED